MQTAEQCVKEAPDYSDGYLILGLAQINSGKRRRDWQTSTRQKSGQQPGYFTDREIQEMKTKLIDKKQ